MEEELDLSTTVEQEITNDGAGAGGAAGAELDIAAQAEQQLSQIGAEANSADNESTTAWDNPDVVSRLNLNSNNDAMTSNAQQAWQETYGIKGGEDNSRPITESAKIEKQAKDDEKQADFIERQQQESEERAERRRSEEERTVARLERMSLGELQQMHAMMTNPEMQAKIESRLSKNGMSKEQIKKGKSEMEEYLNLRMKEEKEGKDKLTAEEKQRLQEISQSKEFKGFAPALVDNYNNVYGVSNSISSNIETEMSRNAIPSGVAQKSRVSAAKEYEVGNEIIKAESITPQFSKAASNHAGEVVTNDNSINKTLLADAVVAKNKSLEASGLSI